MAQQINFGKTVSLKEAEELLINVRSNRFHLRGEPGIGKSSMLKRIGERTGLPVAYIDVPNMDLGDIAMPVVDHASKTTRYYPNARFMLERGEPVVIMLDEFTLEPESFGKVMDEIIFKYHSEEVFELVQAKPNTVPSLKYETWVTRESA